MTWAELPEYKGYVILHLYLPYLLAAIMVIHQECTLDV